MKRWRDIFPGGRKTPNESRESLLKEFDDVQIRCGRCASSNVEPYRKGHVGHWRCLFCGLDSDVDMPIPNADFAREVFGFTKTTLPDTHKLNSDRTVAVATDYFWNEDMSACPTGAKVQLLGAGGVASYGTYNGRDSFWVAWAPLPKRRASGKN